MIFPRALRFDPLIHKYADVIRKKVSKEINNATNTNYEGIKETS